MMRPFMRSFVLLSQIISLSNFIFAEQVDSFLAMKFVKLVQKRYYLVQRMEKPIQMLFALYKNNQKLPRDFEMLLSDQRLSSFFHNDHVKMVLRRTQETHTIQPIYVLWQDFLAYKFIDSEEFVRETVGVLLVLYKKWFKNALNNVLSIRSAQEYAECVLRDFSLDYILDCIETCAENCSDHSKTIVLPEMPKGDLQESLCQAPKEPCDIYENFNALLQLLNGSYDKADFVINNTMRLYNIRRLSKSMDLVSRLAKRSNNNVAYALLQEPVFMEKFQHAQIRSCLTGMQQTGTFSPLVCLWKQFVSYKFIGDGQFLREFVLLIFIVYKQLLAHSSENNAQLITLQQVLDLYDALAALSLPELLNALDDVGDLVDNLNDTQASSFGTRLTAWFKKYWWVPPAVLGAIVAFWGLGQEKNGINDSDLLPEQAAYGPLTGIAH